MYLNPTTLPVQNVERSFILRPGHPLVLVPTIDKLGYGPPVAHMLRLERLEDSQAQPNTV